jgi:prolyl oligopeptidase
MKLSLLHFIAFFLSVNCWAGSGRTPDYPETAALEHYETLHGVRVPDPYRWLEDLNSEETRKWIKAQNRVTFGYLEMIQERTSIRQRLTELWNYERYAVPLKVGGRYFFARNDGLQNQSPIYVLDELEGQPRLLLDPNSLSPDGTVALSNWEVSPDGQWMAYGISSAGSDWQQWRVRSVDTAQDREDLLQWVKFSTASWTADSQGFFYSRYDEPKPGLALADVNYYQKLYFHRLGDSQSDDRLVYERRDQKEWGFRGKVSEDGRHLVIHVTQGTDTRNRVFYKDLQADSPVIELLTAFDASYNFVGNQETLFWFQTDLEAPKGRVIGIDIRSPERAAWTEVLPGSRDTLETVTVVNNEFLANYLRDASSHVRIHDLKGKLIRELQLPGIGSARGFRGKAEDNETFYSFTSFTSPTTIYRYDSETGESVVFRTSTVAFQPEQYETTQVFYRSKDGTRIPMFISHKRGIELNGQNPVLLYGYGGFNIPLTPSFSVTNLVWMEMGGIYAVPNLRGGGEYGREWHQAGTRLQKQNVFDDFIAAAEWLIDRGYTSSSRLAIYGRSNGGLLVGASMNQRPDLFAAAVPGVGVLDMLRFHKFTIGWAWVSDYGSPEDPEDFQALLKYSPYHNVRPGTEYPATLIVTADHDDRVVPSHSFKFAAALQKAQAGQSPVIIRIETRAGHGAGKPTSKQIEESADILAFLVRELKVNQAVTGAVTAPAASGR